MSITVEVRKGNLEQAMRVLKRKVQKEGIVKEIKMRQYFEKPSELKSLYKFCVENNLDSPIVTSINKEGIVKYKEKTFQFMPASAYAYTVGKRTLEKKKGK